MFARRNAINSQSFRDNNSAGTLLSARRFVNNVTRPSLRAIDTIMPPRKARRITQMSDFHLAYTQRIARSTAASMRPP